MEELCRAVMRGDQSLSWTEFQAASREMHDKVDESVEGGASSVQDGSEVVAETGVKDGSEGAIGTGTGVKDGSVAEGCAIAAGAGVKVELEKEELWRQFDEITNEMIITKAGRRMFPLLQVSVSGLQPEASYAILLEFQLTAEHRWRFLNGEWQTTTGGNYSSEPPEPRTIYIHPSSPLTGSECIDKLTFSKLKLSNRDDGKGKIKLQSLYRYQPHLHVVQLPPSPLLQGEVAAAGRGKITSHVFKEIQFVAVTAYQNDQITQMKIKYNPYAKAFQGPQDPIFSRSSHEDNAAKHILSHTLHQYRHPRPPIALATPSHQFSAAQQPYQVLCHPVTNWPPPVSPTHYDTRHVAYYTHHGTLVSRGYQQQHHYDASATPPHLVGQWAGPRTQVHGTPLMGYHDNSYVQTPCTQPPQLECYHTPM